MSNYEFWDELGKIFNAVVAYQEKTVEFNKRFINPWIRLGNVFDKQDRNDEAINAYQKAIDIDPNNAQNWYEVGNIHFRMEKYDDAADDFNHAIDLDPGFGPPYSNLALTLVTQGKYMEAIPLYRKSIELLDDDKDKAVAWNRLGNAYRKLNEYALAVESFQNADELDQENAGFRDNLDEVPDEPTLVEADGDGEGPAIPVSLSLSELLPAVSQMEEAVSDNNGESAPALDASSDVPTQPIQATAGKTDAISDSPVDAPVEAENNASDAKPVEVEVQADQAPVDEVGEASPLPEVGQPVLENAVDVDAEIQVDAAAAPTDEVASSADIVVDDPVVPAIEAVAETDVADMADATVTVVVQSTIETITETVAVTNTSTETSDAAMTVETTEKVADEIAANVEEVVVENSGSDPISKPEDADATTINPAAANKEEAAIETVALEIQSEVVETVVEISSVEKETVTVEAPADQAMNIAGEMTEQASVDQHAYEEYLKDSNDPIHIYQSDTGEKAVESENSQASQDPVAKINTFGELQIEMDTKNAHVWNELGNVYFNTGAFDDAVIAYSKAIELDRWFAWPYSNLALTYVQKGRFVEAILLYQRSIELFTSDKDKAISWNRLGNVYRRINDYENAISSYQRADELDPDNTTISLQSRFSLLGSYVMDPKPSYVS
jgi:tetratricopeptide (TPR) repeat protein